VEYADTNMKFSMTAGAMLVAGEGTREGTADDQDYRSR